MKHLAALTIMFIALLSLAPTSAPAQDVSSPPLNGEMKRLKLHKHLPELPSLSFSLPDGGGIRLMDLRGRIVVLNMWATWCPPCVKELPSLNALQYSMEPNYLTVLAVSVDPSGSKESADFLKEQNLDNLKPYIDTNEQLMRLEALDGAQGIPITLIIDPQGRLMAHYEGDADWNGTDARALFDYYMKNVSYLPYVR